MPADSYVVIWSHSNASISTPPDWARLQTKLRIVAKMDAQRVLCHGEPPTVDVKQTSAFNFVFVRTQEVFLV